MIYEPVALAKQREYVRRIWDVERPCPLCQRPHNPFRETPEAMIRSTPVLCSCGVTIQAELGMFGGAVFYVTSETRLPGDKRPDL